jgi:hypothetical protein
VPCHSPLQSFDFARLTCCLEDKELARSQKVESKGHKLSAAGCRAVGPFSRQVFVPVACLPATGAFPGGHHRRWPRVSASRSPAQLGRRKGATFFLTGREHSTTQARRAWRGVGGAEKARTEGTARVSLILDAFVGSSRTCLSRVFSRKPSQAFLLPVPDPLQECPENETAPNRPVSGR